MRIAIISRRFDPHGGGTERDLITTTLGLKQAGHHVAIYADEIRAADSRMEVRRVPPLRAGRALRLLNFALRAPVAARRDGAEIVLSFARTVGADVIRSGGGAHQRYVRAAAAWRPPVRALAMRLSAYHRVQMLTERWGFAHPALQRVVAVSDLVRAQVAEDFALAPEKAVTIYNGVDLERFKPLSEDQRRAVRRELRLDPDCRIVVFVGSGFARKGLGFLLRSWVLIRQKPLLLVVGGDHETYRFRALAARLGLREQVTFAGIRPQVENIIAVADALALPSLFEPFGNVVAEAMACGVPALVSSRCGVAEWLPDGMRRFVVADPTNPSQIADCVGDLLDESAELRRTVRAIVEPYTWERYRCAMEELLAAVRQPGTATT